MEIKDGKARINASYGLKLPTADVQYGSEDVHLSVTVEFDVDGEFDSIKDRLLEVEADLVTEVKLATFAQLEVEAKELASGVIAPDLSKYAKAAGKGNGSGSRSGGTSRQGSRSSNGRNAKSNGGSRSSNRGTGSRRGSGTTGADKSNLPRVELEVEVYGDEIVATFIDQRDLKRDGTYKPTAADFQEEGGKTGLWLARNGEPNENVLEALDNAGVEYEWDEFV